MKIACLQFAPQAGDIDNNLNRADAVLNKADPTELDELDLLVLPELAFTGYNFKSLQEISPFLEPSGSGISSLWGRTTALKHDCNIVLGYPEKVDVAPIWPASPEYYNSSILINGDGETVANYRKSFLYYADEKWALESKDGFFDSYVSGLGNVALGISSDINPYKLEAPWLAFEFAFHVLHVGTNLVVLSMAWPTYEDSRHYSRMPQEPDMDTITYWVQRLEPLIRAESEEEVVVVFCNRTGSEGDMTYAGSSAVIGIKDGEVCVYGLLGRGVKELLVVDTALPAFAKLVQRTEGDAATRSEAGSSGKQPLLLPSLPPVPPPPRARAPDQAREESLNGHATSTRAEKTRALASAQHPPGQDSGSKGLSDKQPIERHSPRAQMVSERRSSPAPFRASGNPISPRVKAMSPKIEIPSSAFCSQHPSTLNAGASAAGGALQSEGPVVETPTGPSPTPFDMRPKLLLSTTESEFRHVLTPYPGMCANGEVGVDTEYGSMRARPFIFDGSVTVTTDILTPSTPYIEFARENPSSRESKFYGTQSPQVSQTPISFEPRRSYPTPKLGSSFASRPSQSTGGRMPPRPFRSPALSNTTCEGGKETPKKVGAPTPIDPQPPSTTFSVREAGRSWDPRVEAGPRNEKADNMATANNRSEALAHRPAPRARGPSTGNEQLQDPQEPTQMRGGPEEPT